ncbi:Uncharacterised protein [Bordetella pertussis]|nr:Uncharacterised protein [Bordetella pertussis]
MIQNMARRRALPPWQNAITTKYWVWRRMPATKT